jgi:hypothetical protein
MRKFAKRKFALLVIAVLPLSGAISSAWAQQGNTPAPTTNTPTPRSQPARDGAAAPVAPHRQPRAGDIPDEAQSIDKQTKEDRILDQKLKGICNKC